MLDEYFGNFKGAQVTVLGVGVSNLPLIRLLARARADVTARDKREHLGETAKELDALGVRLICGQDYLRDLPACVTFVTPGINPRRPEIMQAAARGAVITSEMDHFMRLCPCPVIGVTGSDGKTTTSTLIYEMLKAAGKSAWLGGNIGTPLLDRIDEMKPTDYAVVEFSSFQLMTVSRPPHIAVITNISPNHLDIHADMDEYVSAKCAIFISQKPEDLLVLNADNEITLGLAAQASGRVKMFSRTRARSLSVYAPEDGAWLDGQTVYCAGRPVMNRADIKLPGLHNVENYMAAAAALDGIVQPGIMRKVAMSFGGVAHRLEFVREINGVRYYNDSIGSSPTRTIAGIKCFSQKVTLIAGGYDKQIPFDELGEQIVKRVKTLLLCGDTAEKIARATENAAGFAESGVEIFRFDELADVVRFARENAESGGVVLFSPACSSFDRYKNFEERGNRFKELVNSLS